MTRAAMFGLAVDAPFALPGIGDDDVPQPGLPPLTLALRPREELLAAWPQDGCERLSDRRNDAGRQVIRVDSHPDEGTFIEIAGEGVFRISADARSADLAPADHEDWRWQRALIGQVLPFAALLNGLEVLHAAAVRLGDSAVAIVGGTHAGKSTLAATWLADGAALVADDVVAVEATAAGPPLVHPGPPLVSLRAGTQEILGAEAVATIGREVGSDEDGARIAVTNRQAAPLPLGGLVILRRDARHDRLDVQREESPDARLILSTTFNFVVQTPRRLTAHLDLAARIAATVPVVVVDAGAGHKPSDITAAIARELGP